MALLSFPVAPANNDLYPLVPVVGQNQYQWSSGDSTWKLVGVATGVGAGTYGDSTHVGQFTVNAAGQITFAQDVLIATTGGTVTQIDTGTGLTGGPITASGTIALDTAYTDTLYLGLAGGTLTGAVTFAVGQGFPGVLPLTGDTMTGDITFAATQTFPGVVADSDYTAVGDLLVGTGVGTYTALPVGADGDVLTANSACAEGVEWTTGGSPATPTDEGTVFALTNGNPSFNTALGYDALNTTTTGAANVTIGASAGLALTSGSINTLIGPAAGCSILDSTQNIAIGFQALGALTTGTGSNIAIGALAGIALTNESFNVVIGAHPGPIGLDCQVVIADGQGTLRAQINECGAISPDGSTYGTLGQFLGSNGATSNWSWIEGVRRVATPASSAVGGTLGEVAMDTGFFYWFDGTQWVRAAGVAF